MLASQLWQDALDVQNASNLSGVVHSFGKVLDALWEEARAGGHGTAWVNTHPITRLWVDKLASLARVQDLGNANVMAAYDSVHANLELARALEARPVAANACPICGDAQPSDPEPCEVCSTEAKPWTDLG